MASTTAASSAAPAASPNDTMVKIHCHDGKEFEVSSKVIMLSVTVGHMLEDLGGDHVVPLPESVKSAAFEKILVWLKYRQVNPLPPVADTEKYRTDNIDPWDQTYMQMEMPLLFDVLLSANYLDIKELLSLCLKTIANMMKGKDPEQIKAIFTLPDQAAAGAGHSTTNGTA